MFPASCKKYQNEILRNAAHNTADWCFDIMGLLELLFLDQSLKIHSDHLLYRTLCTLWFLHFISVMIREHVPSCSQLWLLPLKRVDMVCVGWERWRMLIGYFEQVPEFRLDDWQQPPHSFPSLHYNNHQLILVLSVCVIIQNRTDDLSVSSSAGLKSL